MDSKNLIRAQLWGSVILTIIMCLPLIQQSSINVVAVVLFAISCNFVFIRLDMNYYFVVVTSFITALFIAFCLYKTNMLYQDNVFNFIGKYFDSKESFNKLYQVSISVLLAILSGYLTASMFYKSGLQKLTLVIIFAIFSSTALISEVSVASFFLTHLKLI